MNKIDKKSNILLKNPLPKPTISGILINLRPIVKTDAPAMFKGVGDKEGNRIFCKTPYSYK